MRQKKTNNMIKYKSRFSISKIRICRDTEQALRVEEYSSTTARDEQIGDFLWYTKL